MDLDNLMENVRSFFIEQYKGVESSSSFLSFEPMGSMIDPDDFKDENDQISDIKATEQLSILGDRLPQIEDIFFTNTSRLSSVYEELIESAVFSGVRINTEDKTPYISKFAEVKKESLFKFNESKKASISTPEGNYLPVYGFPKKWFDPGSPFWVGKTFSAKEKKDTPSPKTKPGTIKPLPLVWRTKLMTSPEIIETVETQNKSQKIRTVSANLKIQPVQNVKLRSDTKFMKMANMPFSVSGHISPMSKPGIKNVAKPVVATAKPMAELKSLNVLKNLNFADRIKLTSHIIQNDTAPVAPVHSNEFSMSFQYCIVYLERPWFDTAMFHYAAMWYCLALKENYFSTGIKDENNSGVLKCIPTAMILIKDLKIKAAWTNDDKANAQKSIGLGIFNLEDSKFIDNELVTPGMQIIGWMCDVIPKLPAMNDPNIIS